MLFSFAHCSVINNSMGFCWWPNTELMFLWNYHNSRPGFREVMARSTLPPLRWENLVFYTVGILESYLF